MRFPRWSFLKREIHRLKFGIIPAAIVIGAIVLTRLLGLLQPLEWNTFDSFLKLRPDEGIDRRITIIGIDEADIKKSATYPLSDDTLAELLETLEKYEPRAIGIDIVRDMPVPPGRERLSRILSSKNNIIGIEKVLNPRFAPPPALPPERIGFSDAIPDRDGQYRRVILGTPTEKGYRFSFSLRLAELYLEKEGFKLENGIRDPKTMRFDRLEIPRFTPDSGGYINADPGGLQTILNYRSGRDNFTFLNVEKVMKGEFDPRLLRDRIVSIGVTAPSVPDLVNTTATDTGVLHGQIYGVEFQAHAVGMLIGAVLDGRPLIKTLPEIGEYVAIVLGGIGGLYLSAISTRPRLNLGAIFGCSLIAIALSYLAILDGWWLPVAPVLLAFILNGVLLTAFYQHDRSLRLQIEERQKTIENTFTLIHNGPLQDLALILRSLQAGKTPPTELIGELKKINRELREIGEYARQESLTGEKSLRLGSGLKIDLERPLHELLYEVFSTTLERDFPCFQTLKIKIRSFDPLSREPSLEYKKQLCQFLEESLCNVGKYAFGLTRINAIGTDKNGRYTLIIQDNGAGENRNRDGGGTRQGQLLARGLGGVFKREKLQPKGTICELSWPLNGQANPITVFRNRFYRDRSF